MGLLDSFFGTDVPHGFARVDVVYGVWQDFTFPAGQDALITLAPETHPETVVGFADVTTGRIGAHVRARDVDYMDAISGGRTFFGFGVDGAIAAGLAAAIDNKLAPWDLRVSGPVGEFHLRAWGGLGSQLPSRATWGRVEERLARVRLRPRLPGHNEIEPVGVDEHDGRDEDEHLLLRHFIEGAVPLGPHVDDIDRVTAMWADPEDYVGIERVEADVRCYESFGGMHLTELESECLLVTLALFVKAPHEQFDAWDVEAGADYFGLMAETALETFGEEVVLAVVTALNEAFLDYVVVDPLAAATTSVLARALVGALV